MKLREAMEMCEYNYAIPLICNAEDLTSFYAKDNISDVALDTVNVKKMLRTWEFIPVARTNRLVECKIIVPGTDYNQYLVGTAEAASEQR